MINEKSTYTPEGKLQRRSLDLARYVSGQRSLGYDYDYVGSQRIAELTKKDLKM